MPHMIKDQTMANINRDPGTHRRTHVRTERERERESERERYVKIEWTQMPGLNIKHVQHTMAAKRSKNQ